MDGKDKNALILVALAVIAIVISERLRRIDRYSSAHRRGKQ